MSWLPFRAVPIPVGSPVRWTEQVRRRLRNVGWGFGTSTTNVPTSRFTGTQSSNLLLYRLCESHAQQRQRRPAWRLAHAKYPRPATWLRFWNSVIGHQHLCQRDLAIVKHDSWHLHNHVGLNSKWKCRQPGHECRCHRCAEPSSLILLSIGAVGVVARRLHQRMAL